MKKTNSLPRRTLLGGILAAAPFAALVLPALRGSDGSRLWAAPKNAPPDTGKGPFVLPALPYAFKALEPHIDARTMEIHHDKHHAGYVKNLNAAAEKLPEKMGGRFPEEIISKLNNIPEEYRSTVRNNGGGHANHTMFWAIMKPGGGGNPTGPVAGAINETFGDFEKFKTAFNEAGTKQFGSGWVWLAKNKAGKLQLLTTANQDNPLMNADAPAYPILGNDVWEHAYYLKYQNKRADYLKAWWNTVNWNEVNARYAAAGHFLDTVFDARLTK